MRRKQSAPAGEDRMRQGNTARYDDAAGAGEGDTIISREGCSPPAAFLGLEKS